MLAVASCERHVTDSITLCPGGLCRLKPVDEGANLWSRPRERELPDSTAWD